ncbi:MAG TPA: leucyl aminopeptidase, partial [Stellaceae bacterium]|nr:leucyl aminopeptidase [Stellaceae bacterium]
MKIRFAEPELPSAGTAVAGVWEGPTLTPSAKRLDAASVGAVARALAASPRFSGKKAELLPIVGPAELRASRIVLVGLGKESAADARLYEELGGKIATHLNGAGEKAATVFFDLGADAAIDEAGAAARLALGASLKSYRFAKYKTKQKPEQKPSLERLTLATTGAAKAKRAYAPLEKTAEAVAFARDLVSEPPNVLYPETLAAAAETLRDLGVEVAVLDPDKMRKLGMNALLGVAQGSIRPARLVTMEWRGAGAGDAPLAFIGKGVTFDTGGISIKPAAGMADMKWDMAGSAVVIGLIRLLAARRAKVNAVGVVGLVENMPSGTAQRPGDIVTSMSGQTIEVLNTDAEGRLVLADALWYCQDRFKPRLMIDLATLTGAIIVALGHHRAGLFANDEDIAARLIEAGKAVGEEVWRLPLADSYDREIDSDAADVKNIAGRAGGSVVAAQFLQRFVNGVPWAHLDIAGTAWSSKDAPT